MSPLFSPFTAHSEEEPSSWVGSLVISLILVGACMFAGLWGASV